MCRVRRVSVQDHWLPHREWGTLRAAPMPRNVTLQPGSSPRQRQLWVWRVSVWPRAEGDVGQEDVCEGLRGRVQWTTEVLRCAVHLSEWNLPMQIPAPSVLRRGDQELHFFLGWSLRCSQPQRQQQQERFRSSNNDDIHRRSRNGLHRELGVCWKSALQLLSVFTWFHWGEWWQVCESVRIQLWGGRRMWPTPTIGLHQQRLQLSRYTPGLRGEAPDLRQSGGGQVRLQLSPRWSSSVLWFNWNVMAHEMWQMSERVQRNDPFLHEQRLLREGQWALGIWALHLVRLD